MGKGVAGGSGGPTFTCGKTGKNNWGARQTEQPRVPAWGNKALKPLTEKTYEDCGGRRNSQTHRRGHWRDPWGPGMYTNPPTQESAPKGTNMLVNSRGSH